MRRTVQRIGPIERGRQDGDQCMVDSHRATQSGLRWARAEAGVVGVYSIPLPSLLAVHGESRHRLPHEMGGLD